MSGVDRFRMEMELIEKGWIEDKNEKDRLIPPGSLWENKPESFSIVDARDLQDILSPAQDQDG